jgi:hypothetical protein
MAELGELGGKSLAAATSAKPSSESVKKTAEDDKRQQQADEYREVVASAYTYIEAQKSVQSFAALTPEDLMDRFIERIEGKDTEARPNVLNRIAKIKRELQKTVEKVKALPPSAFRRPSQTKDVNTPVVPSDNDDIYSETVKEFASE